MSNVQQEPVGNIGMLLLKNRLVKVFEILLVFIVGFGSIQLLNSFSQDTPIIKQAIIWFANILMLLVVWAGIKLRGDSWESFGLTFEKISFKKTIRVLLLSLLVFALAMAGFIIGSIIMANISGIPETSNMTRYDYLKDNFGMLLLTLAGVYIVSSFGEEVIYRAFLINRISQLVNQKKLTAISIIISAIIFGLVHYDWGLMGIVQTGFMGLALAICYVKLKKQLWILVLAHAYMDTILMIQMYLASQ